MEQMKSIEDLMDSSIDDLKDLPPFEVPPKGHYKLSLSLADKEVNDKRCIEASFVVLETLELANANEEPAKNGTKFSSLYQLENEFAQGALKDLLRELKEPLGLTGKPLKQVITEVQNVQIAATIKHRQDKKDKDRVYANISNVVAA